MRCISIALSLSLFHALGSLSVSLIIARRHLCVCLQVQFEQSLQAVNPRVTVPYWDYTIDMTAYELSGDIASFFGSVVFGPDYFGAAQSSQRSDHGDDDGVVSGFVDPSGRILSGRFTQVEVSASFWGEASGSVQNAYGHIRSPWNNNNDPYVNRFNLTYGFSAVGGGGPSDRRKLLSLQSGIAKRRRSLLGEEGGGDTVALADRRQLLQTKDQEAKDVGNSRKTAPAARRGGQNERRQREVKAKNRKLGKKGHRELRGLSTEGAEAEDTAGQRMRGSQTSVSSHGGGGVESTRLVAGRKRRLAGTTTEYGSADCGTVYDAMQYTSWYDFGKKLEYQPHGPIHTLIGGTHGADYRATILGLADVEPYFVEAWALLVFGIFKDMWRAGEVRERLLNLVPSPPDSFCSPRLMCDQVTCPASCSADTPVADCKCSCPDLALWTVNASTAKAKLEALDYAIWSNDEFTTVT